MFLSVVGLFAFVALGYALVTASVAEEAPASKQLIG
jgi:hypothetical protein